MSLTPDQSAMLEMLLSKDQSYADMADLLGLDEADVRARARAALTELGGSDPDARVGLTDYLLGQADPIGRADAVRHLRDDPADAELAGRLAGALRDLAPEADLPKLPADSGAGGAKFRPTRPTATPTGEFSGPRQLLGAGRSRLIAGVGSGSLVLVVVVLAIAGVFGGGNDSAGSSGTTAAEQPGDTGGQELSRIPLVSKDGGDATGIGIVGLATGDQPYLDLAVRNLEKAPNGQVYVVWFLIDGNRGFPLAPFATDNKGSYSNRFAIPSASLPLVSKAQLLDVSLAPVPVVQQTIKDALKKKSLAVIRPGTSVLQGALPKQPSGSSSGG